MLFTDFGLIAVFVGEFAIRVAMHLYKYLLSFVGFCDMISIAGLIATSVSSDTRETAFHPDSYGEHQTEDLVALLLIARLLRIFCLDNLKPCLHELWNVIWINRKPLLKTYFALVCVWFWTAHVLYMCEKT